MSDDRPNADIYVIAGPNGAGKSSVIGAGLSEKHLAFFNPDDAAKQVAATHPELTAQEANSRGWREGQRLLQQAIARRERFAFETTLGGRTIARRLESCLDDDGEVRMWFVGLESAELCLQRIEARVASGGHDIPAAEVRRRYDSGRKNLIALLPKLTELRVYDNSAEGNPERGKRPALRLILRTTRGDLSELCRLDDVPEWAKPIAMAALAHSGVAELPTG